MKLLCGMVGVTLFTFSCLLNESEDSKILRPQIKHQNLEDTLIHSRIDRELCVDKIKLKKQKKTPLIIHGFVPLCDNDNQGIVPVNNKLGDGDNLKTNLYWGAGYGVKSYFKKLIDWKIVQSSHINDTILERVVFRKKFNDSTLVYFIADAYNGSQMNACLTDYFNALNGSLSSIIHVEDSTILQLHSDADLIIFNGHNGLMDEEPIFQKAKYSRKKEAIAIACYSFSYFENYWIYSDAYPLLSTTHLLAPEAYTLEAAINAWATGKSGDDIRDAAAKAYSDKHTCSYKTAQKLFKTGW